jgi:hypothetical protein
MSGPLNFNKIKKQMESDGYLRQWNLRAIEVSFKSKAITQEQRDKLIALLYSKGKSDKLFKMRGHHINNRYAIKTGGLNNQEKNEMMGTIMKTLYNEDFLNKYFNLYISINDDSIIEVIEGMDDICILGCRHFDLCKRDIKGEKEKVYIEILEKFKDYAPEIIIPWVNGYKDYPTTVKDYDLACLEYLSVIINDKKIPIKVGDIIRFGDIIKNDDIHLPAIYHNGGFI